jgi:hypothetical protein
MAFKKTAISLIVIAFVTAGIAAVYLWYNFNARSNLILVAPQNCHWFYHFQTRQIRSKMEHSKPKYLDSIAKLIGKMPAFKNVKDPGDVGVTLFSDILLFENDHGRYLALSLNSEPRLQHFFTELVPKNMTGGLVKAGSCNFAKATSRNLYFAFKHKALVIFQPNDTTDNLQFLEKALSELFEEQNRKFVTTIPDVKTLYAKDCDVVFYTAKPNKIPSHGVVLGTGEALLHGAEAKTVSWDAVESMYHLPGMHLDAAQVSNYLTKGKKVSSEQYLELTLKGIFEYLKNY